MSTGGREVQFDVGACADALRVTQPAWSARSIGDRIEILRRWREELAYRRGELVDALSRDTGRRLLSELEVDSVGDNIDRCAVWAADLLGQPAAREANGGDVIIHEIPVPLGVVGVISPWNFPLQLALIDAVPALLAGCAVIVKPSELTQEFVPVLARTIEAVPDLAAVLRFAVGGPDVGREIVAVVDAVCFTGSVRTGRQVARAAADQFIPAFLELGGKDAAIVCASADIDIASSAVLWGATANTGQSCMSIERVYVAEQAADAFLGLLLAKAAKVTLDLTSDGSGQIGPFIDPRQAAVVVDHLADAVQRGAVVHCGGAIESVGTKLFMGPTVVTGVDHSMRLMTEETFGPVIPVMTYLSAEEAIGLANATEYGLSAAVFGAEGEALAIAARIEAGGISINDVCLTGVAPVGEKQSFKFSGLGPSRMGPSSVNRFLRRRIALVRTTPQRQPWWYDGAVAR